MRPDQWAVMMLEQSHHTCHSTDPRPCVCVPPYSTWCRLELAFNGNGALLASGSPATIVQEWDGSCSTSPLYRQLGCQGADSTQEAYASSKTGSKDPFCMNCGCLLTWVCLP
jgi:hypothetical protein